MHRNHLWPLLAAGSVAALACAAPARAQEVNEFQFSLPAQDLSVSLREVSVRSGRSIIAPAELVRERQAPALSGPYSAEGAVRTLLAGSGLAFRLVGDALVVFRPVASNRSRQGDASGEEADGADERIFVTGTNLRGAQLTSPLVQIDRQEIERTGATSVEQLMRRVPQNTQGGVNQENAGIVVPDTDVTNHGAGLNLRGLGQRATLVLVNGRRLAPSGSGSFVDVSLIPLSAVERVDILPDGASAIYGSDAVGGVVNFILRDGAAGIETSFLAGTTTRGGGSQLQASQSVGGEWGSGNGLLAYEYRLEEEIRAAQRPVTIGLRPGTYLLPRERRHSLLGMIEQDVAPGLRTGLTASYARRNTERTAFQAAGTLPVEVEARAEAVTLAGQLSYELGGGWLVQLDGNYALADTSQLQDQPGGNPLVNARDVRSEIVEGSLRLDGALFDLPGGPVRLAVGALARREDYRDTFESSSIAEIVRSADRNVSSAFGELSVPLFSRLNRRPGLERLIVSAAGRYDRYGGTGSTFDPKLGLLWSPVTGLDLRASWGTSFRAPLLSETTGAYTAIYVPAILLFADPAQAPPGGIGLILQGNDPDVRPETSRTWSLGAELAPRFAPGLTLSFNYYAIRFSDRIAFPVTALNVVGNPAFDPIVDLSPDQAGVAGLVDRAQVILDATGGATPADVDVVLDTRVSNTAVTRTRGFDLALRYAFDWSGSRFTVDAAVTHIIAFDDQLTVASPVVRALDRPFRPLDWRGRGGVGWTRGGWTGSLFLNFADAYLDDRLALARRVEAHATLDASLAYAFGPAGPQWLRGTRISLFAENLLGADPPFLAPAPGSATGVGYDPVNASARGRFVAVQLRRNW